MSYPTHNSSAPARSPSCLHQPRDSCPWPRTPDLRVWLLPPALLPHCPSNPSVQPLVGSMLLPTFSLCTCRSLCLGWGGGRGWSLSFLLSDCSRQNSETAPRFPDPGVPGIHSNTNLDTAVKGLWRWNSVPVPLTSRYGDYLGWA